MFYDTDTTLTLHSDGESVAGGGRDAVARHAEVVAHVQPRDLVQPQPGALHSILLLLLLLLLLLPHLHDVGLLAAGHEDVVAVLAAPDDVRGRVAGGVARQAHVVALPAAVTVISTVTVTI